MSEDLHTDREFGFHTRAVHAGARPEPGTGARAVPIYQTSSYVFEDPESAAAYFNLQEYGNTYSRIMNPTVAALEERLANLEGGIGAVAFASGLAAQSSALFTMLTPGDHVLASAALYGGTVTQLKHLARKLSLGLTFIDPDDPAGWRAALRDETRVLFAETNHRQPRRQRAGHRGGGEGCRGSGDTAHGGQHLCDPLPVPSHRMGRGHRGALGDPSSSAATAPASAARWWIPGTLTGRTASSASSPDPSPAYHGLAFHETFGTYGYLMKLRSETLRDLGGAMAPLNAFLFMQGLETLRAAHGAACGQRPRRGRVA